MATARLISAIALLATATGAAADEAPQDRRIAYALTDYAWEVYQTPDGKAECPNGFNDGPREQFAMLFPENGPKRTLVETQLLRENQTWRPDTSPDALPFREAIGNVAYGMNLDGKIDADDFTNPDGEKGVDNQLHRAIGCIGNFRGTAGTLYQFTSKYLQQFVYDRVVIEISEVDSLINDDSVVVTSYRGSEDLMTDATGNGFLPGGSQTVDTRWGKSFIHSFRGKIVDGVLISEPNDFTFPSTAGFEDTSIHEMRAARFRMSLTPERMQGLLAGYVDVEAFHVMHNKARSTHLLSYGQQSSISLYKALRRLADGYPDSATGENTAISSAIIAKFVQVHLRHPPQQTSMNGRDEKKAVSTVAGGGR
jgi:hypothetical protein